MNRQLVLLNVALGLAAVALGAAIVREATEPRPAPTPLRVRTTSPAPASESVSPTVAGEASAASAAFIATRNLFSPTRTETPPTPVATPMAARLPKPNLYGVVMREGSSLAYLEDPATRRVASYRVGDAIAGGTITTIEADRVVLTRPDGPLDVRLHDPSRPRPATVPVGPGVPAQPGVSPPVTMPPGFGQPTSPALGQPSAEDQPRPPVRSLLPGRRPFLSGPNPAIPPIGNASPQQ